MQLLPVAVVLVGNIRETSLELYQVQGDTNSGVGISLLFISQR